MLHSGLREPWEPTGAAPWLHYAKYFATNCVYLVMGIEGDRP
jgi:hypothetical protein